MAPNRFLTNKQKPEVSKEDNHISFETDSLIGIDECLWDVFDIVSSGWIILNEPILNKKHHLHFIMLWENLVNHSKADDPVILWRKTMISRYGVAPNLSMMRSRATPFLNLLKLLELHNA